MTAKTELVPVDIDDAALRALQAYLPPDQGALELLVGAPWAALQTYVPRVPDHVARAIWSAAPLPSSSSGTQDDHQRRILVPNARSRSDNTLVRGRRRTFWDSVHVRDPHAAQARTSTVELTPLEEEISLRVLRHKAPTLFQRTTGSLVLPPSNQDQGLPEPLASALAAPPGSTSVPGANTAGPGKGEAFARLLHQLDQSDAAQAYAASSPSNGAEGEGQVAPGPRSMELGVGSDSYTPSLERLAHQSRRQEEQEFVPEEESDDDDDEPAPPRPNLPQIQAAQGTPDEPNDNEFGLRLFASQMRARFLAADSVRVYSFQWPVCLYGLFY